MKTNFFKLKIIFFVAVFFVANVAVAVVASSTNYQIESDAISIAGTENSSSTNYRLSDTVGEVGSGNSSSTSYVLYGGYRQANTASSTISISSPADVTLSSGIDLDNGGSSTGQISWTVTTDSSSGYTLSVKADSSPALTFFGNAFNDYSPSGGSPDYSWSMGLLTTAFGFSPEGSDITSTYKDNGSACNTGSGNTSDTCWNGFSTSDKTIASSASANSPTGTATVVKMRAEATAGASISEGNYSATITATAVAL